ncbi:hypothetical protein ACFPC0_27800 [Streptomyces andamanensis]|uniref:Uncharacterized protein n=1 Tax=Streptomyces andamanensis TaxID=1565035 RepID=A0ABV8TLF3_9ACTN
MESREESMRCRVDEKWKRASEKEKMKYGSVKVVCVGKCEYKERKGCEE